LVARSKAISIVGLAGSGKTELICRLLNWLAPQGLRVAVLKHTHHSAPGDRGKDTWRFRQAGARVVALAAPGLLQISHSFPAEPALSEILAALSPEVDLILVEGYKAGPLPKIAVLNPALEERLPELSQVIALVGPAPSVAAVPVFPPEEVAAIGAFILAHLGLSVPGAGSPCPES
jgi:molybdopterin-guanine dinucleotide biosynthesis protein MobB